MRAVGEEGKGLVIFLHTASNTKKRKVENVEEADMTEEN